MASHFLRFFGLLVLASALASCSPNAESSTTATAPAVAKASPVTVSIEDSGATTQIQTRALTVSEALGQAGIRLYHADEVQPTLDTAITPQMTIVIQRAQPIILQADGKAIQTRTRRARVGEVLAEVGLALVGEDYAIPAPDQPLPEDSIIRVVRVRTEILTEQEIIPYETVFQALPEVEIDNVRQVQAGVNGLKLRRTRVRYEDGLEVSRVAEGEMIAQAAVPRVLGYGTNIVVRTLDTPNGPLEYWRNYTVYATSYAAKFLSRPSTSPNYGRTASGKILTKGLVAVDRSLIPFGTRLYVPGYGFAEAADTGGGVKGRFVDLGFDDWNYESWHQVVTLYFLTPVPPANQITWIIPSTVP